MCSWGSIACTILLFWLLLVSIGAACSGRARILPAVAVRGAHQALRDCEALRAQDPEVWAALEWPVTPGPSSSTDLTSESIQIAGGTRYAYDADTLRRVLVHELVHAALRSPDHGKEFQAREAAVLALLERAGVLERGGMVNPFYPAQILPESLRA